MTEIVVEIGLNHLGSEERAWRMLESAAAPSIDAVTFQIREETFYENPEPARRRLSVDFYKQAIEAVHARGQKFGIAIADEASVGLFDSIGVDFWKTLSWDFKNRSLQNTLQATGKSVMRSTGLSSMDEIEEGSASGGNVVLLHTQLSQKIEDVNLKAISEIGRRTKLPVAYGLHCSDHDVLKTAIAFEPYALLFYVKEEKRPDLFDDEHAILTSELTQFTGDLKSLMMALGDGNKNSAEKPSWVAH